MVERGMVIKEIDSEQQTGIDEQEGQSGTRRGKKGVERARRRRRNKTGQGKLQELKVQGGQRDN